MLFPANISERLSGPRLTRVYMKMAVKTEVMLAALGAI